MTERRACMGGATRPTREGPEHFEECRACGTGVRFDLVDHPFFGFRASCDHRTQGGVVGELKP